MRLTFNFQTLILLTLTVVLTVATAVWGAVVYQSIYDIILGGFDRKLIALSNGAAEFTDGDGHAAYQRPREIQALTVGPEGRLLGFDRSRGEVVEIDPADGGALPAAAFDLPPLRSLAFDPQSGRLAALAEDGLSLSAAAEHAAGFAPVDGLAGAVDQVLFLDGRLYLRRGTRLRPAEGDGGALTLAEAVVTLAPGANPGQLVGIAQSDGALLQFGADGALTRRLTLSPGAHEIGGLAWLGGKLYASGSSLLRIDPASGAVAEEFYPGWYTERDPYFERHVHAYRRTREIAGLTFLYTLVYLGEDQIRYILDGSLGDDHSPPGYPDDVPDEATISDYAQAQSRGLGFVSAIREWEEWGLIKAASDPIYDSNGRIVALSGADVDIGVIREKTRYALFAVIFVGAGLLLLAGSVSYRVSQSLMRPLRDIKDSALRIAAGYHGSRVAYDNDDEIGQLAQSLNALSSRLAAQARQSEAYRAALATGREQIALEHALNAQLAAGIRALPPRMLCENTAVEHGACAHGEIGLLWSLVPGTIDALQICAQQARVQALAHALLQRLAPLAAQDVLFQTVPTLAAVGCWDSALSQLAIRTREDLTLLLIEADGSARSLRAGDGARIQLAAGQHLAWADGQVLLGPTDAAGTP